MHALSEVIVSNPNIMGGTPVFSGTRVPIQSLFDHLELGISLDNFLDDFPTVTRNQAIAVIKIAEKLLTSSNLQAIYETAA
jgi:uncharacterized protein (DUF433 family)